MTQLNELQVVHDQYEGPLDLLLRMLEVRELDITQVSLSLITSDFLAYLDQVGEHNPALLGEFLSVASRLIHLKSSLLLPVESQNPPEIETEESLEEQLKHYKAIKDAASLLKEAGKRGEMLARSTEVKPVLTSFTPISTDEFARLSTIFIEIMAKQVTIIPLDERVMEQEVSLEEKVGHLRRLLKRNTSLDLVKTLRSNRTHTEIVVSFLAILELLKLRVLRFDGVLLWRIEA